MTREKNIYKIFLAGGILLFLYSLWHRIPDIDGAWIGENAYWLAKTGYAKSELMRGITSQETLTVIHHKLFNLTGALSIKLFGFSVYTLKSISLFFFIVLLALMNQYSKSTNLTFSKSDRILLFILMLYFPWVFKYSFVYRPEIMITTLGFAAYVLLEKVITGHKKKNAFAWFSGLLIGLAIATHLNGIVIAASAVTLLLWNKQYKTLVPLLTGIVMGAAIYFYDFFGTDYFSFWYYQFFNSPTVKDVHEYPIWVEPIINLLSEHMRYFHDFKIIVFTLFMIAAFLTGFKYAYRNHKTLTRFTVLMFVFTGMLTIHDTRKYIILNLPYILLLIVIIMKALREGKINIFKFKINAKQAYQITFGLMMIYLLVSFGYDFYYSLQKFTPLQNRKISLKYAGSNIAKTNVVAPLTFIFNEIEYYNHIQGEVCYTEFQKAEPDLKGVKFLEKAESYGNSLLIITPYYQHLLGIDDFKKGKRYGDFVVKEKNPKHIILVKEVKNP